MVRFIFVDSIYHNALTNCAARLCRALCRVAHMCSRTVSDTANMSRQGSTLCSPTVEKILCRSPISQRSHVGNLRQTLQGKGVIHKRVENRRCLPSYAPAASAAIPRGECRSPPLCHSALFAQKRRTVHTVRAHRKVCAEKSSLEKRTPVNPPDVFPCAMPQNALYLFYMT